MEFFLDQIVFNSIQSIQNPIVYLLFWALTAFGNPVVWIAFSAWLYWSQKEKESFYWMHLMLWSSAITAVLKLAIRRERPPHASEYFSIKENVTDYSFPSGHATNIASVYAFARNKLENRWKWAFGALVILVAFSRLYLSVHWLNDVIAGLALGTIIGLVNYKFQEKTEHLHFKLSKLQEEGILFLAILLGAAAIWLQGDWVFSGIFIGYFVGFMVWKELNLQQTGKSLKRKAIGYLGLLALFGEFVLQKNPSNQFMVLLIAGAWITLLYPLIVEKWLKSVHRNHFLRKRNA